MSSFVDQIVNGVVGIFSNKYDERLDEIGKEVKAHDAKLDKLIAFMGADNETPPTPPEG